MQELVEPKVGDVVFTSESGGVVAEAVVSRHTDEGYFAKVVVKKGGEMLWESGYASDPGESFAFGAFFDGVSLPAMWQDIDNDGKPELLAPMGKGDISPTIFRIFRWTGEELHFVKRRCLIKHSDAEYRWMSFDDTPLECVWVDFLDRDGKADIVGVDDSGVKRESFMLKPTAEGFQVA